MHMPHASIVVQGKSISVTNSTENSGYPHFLAFSESTSEVGFLGVLFVSQVAVRGFDN